MIVLLTLLIVIEKDALNEESMKLPSLQVLCTSVLLVLLSAIMITAPITAQAGLAPGTFDCITATGIPPTECEALVALYNSTNGAGWARSTGWLTTDTPCSWSGVSCSAEHVTELDLRYNQLSGSIPPELGNLANLLYLDLSYNQLSGRIPSELCKLTNVRWLYLSNNQLSGSIPPCWGNLANLQDLYLNSNQLSGSIPSELGNLANLHYLYLNSNQLSGSIPSELGNLANL